MNKLIQKFKSHVIETASNEKFVHHKWFVKYHLDIVEKIALELCDIYTNADRDLVLILVWLHDYGKTLNFANQYEETLVTGKKKLLEIGFSSDVVEKAISYVRQMDAKTNLGADSVPIEIKIISSADGASHLVGPFFFMYWYENSNMSYEALMESGIRKIDKDWGKKIVLPEVINAFKTRRDFFLEQSGKIPSKFLS